jgi:hypothetical protein
VVRVGGACIAPLHQATARDTVVSGDLLDQWTGPSLRLLAEVTGAGEPGLVRAGERLRAELEDVLVGRPCSVAWTHGDLWVGNLLLAGDVDRVVGIVDWDAAHPSGLPVTDLLHLLLTARGAVERVHFGALVADLVDQPRWGRWEATVLAALEQSLPAIADHGRAATLLTWLGHVGAVLAKQPSHAARNQWVAHNVRPVLRRL